MNCPQKPISRWDSQPHTLTISLLVISSDSVARDLLEVILKQQGTKVDCASNLTQGLDAIREHEYHAVFIDTRWHGVAPGKLMLDISRSRGTKQPMVIFIVECNDTSSMREIRQAGADAIISYPFNHHDIVPVMEILTGDSSIRRPAADGHATGNEHNPNLAATGVEND